MTGGGRPGSASDPAVAPVGLRQDDPAQSVADAATPARSPEPVPSPDQARVQAIFRRDWDAHVANRAAALAAAAPALADLGIAAGDLPIGVVPHQNRPLTPLPGRRRAAFVAHLDQVIAQGFALALPQDVDPDHTRPEPEVVGATCAACQGTCCTLGGLRMAFLAPEDIARQRRRDPGLDPGQLRARYLAALPERSVDEACVFQGARGCTLDRADRAPVCNRYHCNGQTDLVLALAETGARRAVIIAHDPTDGTRVQLFTGRTAQG